MYVAELMQTLCYVCDRISVDTECNVCDRIGVGTECYVCNRIGVDSVYRQNIVDTVCIVCG